MNKIVVALVGLAVAMSSVLFVVLFALDDDTACAPGGPVLGQGLPSVDGVTMAGLNQNQLQIAKLTVQVGEQRGISETGIMAALMAAAQESTFQNYANSNVPESLSFPHDAVGSDYDSVGPWQMRASIHGKDGIAALMDPTYQANWFYDTLNGIDGWQTQDPAQLAAIVENPRGDLRGLYAAHSDMAAQLYAAFKGSGGGPAPAAPSGPATCAPGTGTQTPPGDFNARVLAAAQKWLGTDYVWGGGDQNGPTAGGFDCSGLVLYAVAQASNGTIVLPHYTQSQQDDPRAQVITRDQMAPGDVVFFTSPGESDSHHVGIYAGDGKLLHAPETGDVVKYSPISAFDGERWDIRRYGSGTPASTDPNTAINAGATP
ncbi:C40 family peptidase [Nocardia veterana]|uniref:C40 family peptidase n=1 Tax=Nocardia veterana TaxID=132249 RepID=UPI0003123B52|nr:C40 family peptidase [Nocardia veterana]